MFDSKERATISAKKKLAKIAERDEAAHGVAPIRGYFKCDQSKILERKDLESGTSRLDAIINNQDYD